MLMLAIVMPALVGRPPATYASLKATMETDRLHFQQRHATCDGTSEQAVIDSARTYLFERIASDLLPAWYGTPWDFNGTTRTPKEGAIACGYFVNTVLQDAGFRLPRVKWSQLAAEGIVLHLTHDVKRFRERPVQEVEAYIRSRGDGVHLVGLDDHVGFIVAREGAVRFVHSNYYHRDIGVMSEPLDGVNPLAASHYRIVGMLLTDALVRDWIMGTDLADR